MTSLRERSVTRCLSRSAFVLLAIAAVFSAYVQLYKTLGGGWNLTDAQWGAAQKRTEG
jgi:hypothetical protein